MFRFNLLLYLLLLSVPLHQAYAADRQQYVENTGDVLAYLFPAVVGVHALYKKDLEGGMQYGESLGTSLATTFILKYSIDAKRPNGDNSRSFPSGHTSTAFVSAAHLQMRYGWAYGLPAYAVAAFVAWSRVYTQHHYSRDVIAGTAIGVVSSYIFTEQYQEKVTISPIADNGIYGLSFISRFSTY